MDQLLSPPETVAADGRFTPETATAKRGGDLLLSINAISHETPDILVLELVATDGGALPSWSPGAHVDIVLPSGLIRQYSLCGDPSDLSKYRVAVLREAPGRGGSREIHELAKQHMVLPVRGPRNHFELVDAPAYLFIAGGIGITPMLPMILAAERAGRPWRVVYGGRSRTTMAFLGEIAQRGGGKVTLLFEDETGRPDLDDLLGGVGAGEAVYACGPSGMLTALEATAGQRGLSKALHIERFTAASDLSHGDGSTEDPSFEVELRNSGLTLQVPADRSLGDTLIEAGVEVPFSCQEGYCGSCETRVLEGVPDHRDSILTPEERAAGNIMMVCCGRSKTPRLVLDL